MSKNWLAGALAGQFHWWNHFVRPTDIIRPNKMWNLQCFGLQPSNYLICNKKGAGEGDGSAAEVEKKSQLRKKFTKCFPFPLFLRFFPLTGAWAFAESCLVSVQRKPWWAVSTCPFLWRRNIAFLATHQVARPDLYRAKHTSAVGMIIVTEIALFIFQAAASVSEGVRTESYF